MILKIGSEEPSAVRLAKSANSLQAFEPGTARAQEGLKVGPRSCRGVYSAPFYRADSESADESGDRG
eukprot:10575377-Alexandrium_andersonii.AAC.1